MALGVVLSGAWFADGNPSAPDSGLVQIDLLMLAERVPGVDAVDGRPTVVVAAGQCSGPAPAHRTLADRFRVVVTTDPQTARRLALPRAADGCLAGYVLLAGDGTVRYRTYDPGWPDHGFEQGVLLDAIADGRGHGGGHP